MPKGWFDSFSTEWDNDWTYSESSEDIPIAVTITGTSTFACRVIAQSSAPPVRTPTVGGGRSGRKRKRLKHELLPQFAYAKFKINAASTSKLVAVAVSKEISYDLPVVEPVVPVLVTAPDLKFLNFNWRTTSNTAIKIRADSAAKVKYRKKSSTTLVRAEAVEIDLLEEEELALLLLL